MSRIRNWNEIAVPVAPKHYRRLAGLGCLLILALGGLMVRLVDLHVWQADGLRNLAETQRQQRIHYTPERGRILDRHGNTLAQSVVVKTVKADPSLVERSQVPVLASCLAGPLGMEIGHLRELLGRNYRTNDQGEVTSSRYVLLKRFVPVSRWMAARVALEELDLGEEDPRLTSEERRRLRRQKQRMVAAIQSEPIDQQVRYYPFGTLASQVIGFVASKDDPVNGAEGIEYSFNSILRGVDGWARRAMVKRGSKAFFEETESLSARPGLHVRLAMDARVQGIIERELGEAMKRLRPTSISCVVVDPRTGEILALANQPTYDPNRYGESSPDQRRNRAITDFHEPGSTFKVITIGGALDSGVVGLDDRIDCERGRFHYRGMTLGDVHPNDILTVQDVVAKSSNIGAAKVGLMMGEEALYAGIRRFGIGQSTGIPVAGEGCGILHPTARWSGISLAWIPMGHEVAATPLQMTMAVAAVANEGRLMRPLLVRTVEDETGQVVVRISPQVRGQAISARTARQMTQALERAVEEGTGRRARLEGYRIAGKTGTAQKLVQGRYVNDQHYASFIGFFPADAPQLCVGVFVDDPKLGSYGGETAAPIFREIAMQAAAYLGISPGKGAGGLTQELARRESPGNPADRGGETPGM